VSFTFDTQTDYWSDKSGSDGYTYCGARTYTIDPAYPFVTVSSILEHGWYVNQLTVTASSENEGGYSVPMTVALTNYPTVTWTETITVNINEPADPDTVCSIIPGEYENELLATYFVDSGAD
jgi:hypothetical protein